MVLIGNQMVSSQERSGKYPNKLIKKQMTNVKKTVLKSLIWLLHQLEKLKQPSRTNELLTYFETEKS